MAIIENLKSRYFICISKDFGAFILVHFLYCLDIIYINSVSIPNGNFILRLFHPFTHGSYILLPHLTPFKNINK